MAFLTKHVLWQVTGAADEVVESIDSDELAKFFALKCDAEDEAAEVSTLIFWLFTHTHTLEQEMLETVFHFDSLYSTHKSNLLDIENEEENGNNSRPVGRSTLPERIGFGRDRVIEGRCPTCNSV